WSRCGIEITFMGGRARMMSARSRATSISTRNPSRLLKAGSWVVIRGPWFLFAVCASVDNGGLIGFVFAGHQLPAQQFSDGRFRQGFHELEAARPLEVG